MSNRRRRSSERHTGAIDLGRELHNKCLKAEGLAFEDQWKKKLRKWNRYDRKYSLSAEHVDWSEVDGTDIKVCIILDDTSRKVLAGGEFSNINTENSKVVLSQVEWIVEANLAPTGFKEYLETLGIKLILGRVAHPGKVFSRDALFLQSTSSSIGIMIDLTEAWIKILMIWKKI